MSLVNIHPSSLILYPLAFIPNLSLYAKFHCFSFDFSTFSGGVGWVGCLVGWLVKCGNKAKPSLAGAWSFTRFCKINANITCSSNKLIYCLTCDKCGKQYIGETERELKERIQEQQVQLSGRN